MHAKCKKNRNNAVATLQHFLESRCYTENLVLAQKGSTPYLYLYIHAYVHIYICSIMEILQVSFKNCY